MGFGGEGKGTQKIPVGATVGAYTEVLKNVTNVTNVSDFEIVRKVSSDRTQTDQMQ